MRRLPPREQKPENRPSRVPARAEGPFDRLLKQKPERDPAPFIIGGTLGLLALVIILVFVFSSALGGGESGAIDGVPEGIEVRTASMPGLPPGLTAVSDFYQFQSNDKINALVGLRLKERLDSVADLSFYTYTDGRWQRVAAVRLGEGGKVGEAEFSPVPSNLSILRLVGKTYQIGGSLPPGGALHPDARVSIISPRDYTPSPDGAIQGTATGLEQTQGVAVIPTIIGSDESTAAAVNAVLSSAEVRQRHIQAIAQQVSNGKFSGIDLEYTAVDPDKGQAFTEMAQGVAEELHRNGAKLSLTLPAPTGEKQPYDWKKLGETADIIRVLPVSDPAEYWQKMPGAISQVVKDVDPKKVVLVISPFSVERSSAGLAPIGWGQAMAEAAEIRVEAPGQDQIRTGAQVRMIAPNLDDGAKSSLIRWSDEASILTFSVGGTRTVYLENLFSARFKLEMVQAYGLAGAAISDASDLLDAANIWPAFSELLESGSVKLSRPNGEALVPRWTATAGEIGKGTGTKVTWTAPSAGAHAIEFVISDGDKRFGSRLSLQVQAAATPTPSPAVTFPPDRTATPTATATPSATASRTSTPSPTKDASPAPITGLTAASAGSGKIQLSWNASPENDIDHYNIWRANRENVLRDFLVSVSENTTKYLDSGLSPETTYYYVVTAVDANGNESTISNVASAKPSQ